MLNSTFNSDPFDSCLDCFDSILNLEKDAYEEGYEEGKIFGQKRGQQEGKEVGIVKGFEYGVEISYYTSICQAISVEIQLNQERLIKSPNSSSTSTFSSFSSLPSSYPLPPPSSSPPSPPPHPSSSSSPPPSSTISPSTRKHPSQTISISSSISQGRDQNRDSNPNLNKNLEASSPLIINFTGVGKFGGLNLRLEHHQIERARKSIDTIINLCRLFQLEDSEGRENDINVMITRIRTRFRALCLNLKIEDLKFRVPTRNKDEDKDKDSESNRSDCNGSIDSNNCDTSLLNNLNDNNSTSFNLEVQPQTRPVIQKNSLEY